MVMIVKRRGVSIGIPGRQQWNSLLGEERNPNTTWWEKFAMLWEDCTWTIIIIITAGEEYQLMNSGYY
jgi:hypothetical protein